MGNQIVNNNKNIIVNSNQSTYVLDAETGTILFKKNFSSIIRPIIIDQYFLSISKNNFLIMTNINTGKILYSLDLNQEVANFLKSKKREIQIKNTMIVNDKIYIFLKNLTDIFLKFP